MPFQPELQSWGARPPTGDAGRALAASIWRVKLKRTLETFQCARAFPRGRGKLRPGRARSRFYFGIRVHVRGSRTTNVKPKLLIVELWGLGDLIIATPFIRAAADKFDITLLAKPFALDLQPRFWPEVQVAAFTAPWTAFKNKYLLWHWPLPSMLRLRRQLAAEQFDCGLSARWDPRDHLLLKLAGTRNGWDSRGWAARVF